MQSMGYSLLDEVHCERQFFNSLDLEVDRVASHRLAYRAGVTTGISAPLYRGFYGGLGTSFNLGAENKLESGAVIQETTALHVSVRHFGAQPSVSTQIAVLRQLLLSGASATKTSAAASSTERIGAFADVAKVGHSMLTVKLPAISDILCPAKRARYRSS